MRTVLAAFLLASAAGWAVHARITQPAKLDSVLSVSEFVHDWQVSKQFTLNVANAMPAEFYSFKPNAEEMSFGEQIIHIAGANVFRFQQISGVKPPFEFDPAHPPASDKATATKLLEQSFDYVLSVLPQITPEQLQRTWHIPPGRAATIQTAGR
jgi:DinB superfamily